MNDRKKLLVEIIGDYTEDILVLFGKQLAENKPLERRRLTGLLEGVINDVENLYESDYDADLDDIS